MDLEKVYELREEFKKLVIESDDYARDTLNRLYEELEQGMTVEEGFAIIDCYDMIGELENERINRMLQEEK